jgi:hypothetical protein
MDLLETLKILLDNERLMEEYDYNKEDVKKLNLKHDHENGFIQFMQTAVKLMNNDGVSDRIVVNNLIKAFEV